MELIVPTAIMAIVSTIPCAIGGFYWFFGGELSPDTIETLRGCAAIAAPCWIILTILCVIAWWLDRPNGGRR